MGLTIDTPITTRGDSRVQTLLEQYEQVRSQTEFLVAPLHREDMVVQSMEDTSPTKWHLAHTTWFFETFVLVKHCPGYQLFHNDFPYLFNSYYVQAGPRFSRPRRGMITRPTVDMTMEYRHYVDEEMRSFLSGDGSMLSKDVVELVTLGLNHEQQHQELIVTDIKHVLHQNPLRPAYRAEPVPADVASDLSWLFFEEGLFEIGVDEGDAFMFDNEGPSHRVFLESFYLADRLSTAAEYLEFIEDGGYERPELWLSAGWAAVEAGAWSAPIYWERRGDSWFEFTMSGLVPLRIHAPVCHVSYFEADAFARWSKARLCTESEWEVASAVARIDGNFVESGSLRPLAATPVSSPTLRQVFGDVWEWTRSQYSPYPRYAPVGGAIGEYNGKFMCNQFVLRGASCATPQSHIRRTYRNFFPPEARWQFAGVRLASDAQSH